MVEVFRGGPCGSSKGCEAISAEPGIGLDRWLIASRGYSLCLTRSQRLPDASPKRNRSNQSLSHPSGCPNNGVHRPTPALLWAVRFKNLLPDFSKQSALVIHSQKDEAFFYFYCELLTQNSQSSLYYVQ
jgi:hypothetical protein